MLGRWLKNKAFLVAILSCLLLVGGTTSLAEPTGDIVTKSAEARFEHIKYAKIKFELAPKAERTKQLGIVNIQAVDPVVFTGKTTAYLAIQVGSGQMDIAWNKPKELMLEVPLSDGKLPASLDLSIVPNAPYLTEDATKILLNPKKNDYISLELRNPDGQPLFISNSFLST